MDGPDSTTAANNAEQVTQGVTVHILLASSEPPERLTLQNLNKKTTLGELKKKIQDAKPSNPSPAQQRLLYMARHLARDEMTLEDIFGSLEVWRTSQEELEEALTLNAGT